MEEYEKKLLTDAKQAIVDYINAEFDADETLESFDNNNKDLRHVGIAYTTTEDNEHDINFELNLIDYTWSQYVDDIVVDTGTFIDDNTALHPLIAIKEFMCAAEFVELTSLDDEKLEAAGFKLDDEGYIVHPSNKLEKDINTILKIVENNYEAYVKAVISAETGVTDINALNHLYGIYNNQDNIQLINQELVDMANVVTESYELQNDGMEF